MKIFFCILFFSTWSTVYCQQTEKSGLPFYEIPPVPEKYTAGMVASRVIDGLGFRFYWATEGLTEKDMQFKPGEGTRTIAETIEHIYIMTSLIYRSVYQRIPDTREINSIRETREAALLNIEMISSKLKSSKDNDLDSYIIEFGNGKVYPFWYMLNGPIADCIWHCGQIASLRRSSGNPLNPDVSLLNGKKKE